MKRTMPLLGLTAFLWAACDKAPQEAADLMLNDKEYFETQGVNVLVFSNTSYYIFGEAFKQMSKE